ncbi:TetR/AcrR family transcriptional regulator [Bacillus thuringiensis]|jgi:TetR/AcrR family transcriptional regulator, transcriptional repressor for nem operon|uniref:TetR family transcriptional regulator n=5 Tax=Bacillus cereus group TaxID=86661 RepID=A0A9X6TS35_BACTU|nr:MULTISPECIES: TetR/AcrR family transcriptional regulator [Bacillus]EAO52481.1 Transcriptional regulator, TetR family [Bacillus thuringiensis serovar israelensis ATCC 35646]MED1156192.1 TetR/AcrR family transcriptional regulator [Bacillus paranthracis]OUB31250.1 TetR family transcriptional regulator [Bacillus thuringiensis serovar yunnanensis]ACK97675.1 transcriptional regulator, TetR family [Bacillus cereus G9842]AFQ26926.1 TetR family transcriptional regulator [Bacillus thuringiensis HD-78
MARLREFDEEKALDAAMQLFWEKGYAATSLSDLTARMEIQKPSLYSAFGDKEGLFEAALRRYTNLHAARIRTKLQNEQSVKEAIQMFFENMVEEEYKKEFSKGCFCINTMVELAPHNEKFEVLTREHQMYLAVIFQELIMKGIRSGELQSDLNAKALAQTLVTSLIGLTVLMKSRPERSVIDNSVSIIVSLVK